MVSGLRGAFAAALPQPMYRITCPSRTRLHARFQVLAMHRGLMYRITGHYHFLARRERRAVTAQRYARLTGRLRTRLPGDETSAPRLTVCGCGRHSDRHDTRSRGRWSWL